MSISVLAKVKEFTEFWRMWLNELYEIEPNVWYKCYARGGYVIFVKGC